MQLISILQGKRLCVWRRCCWNYRKHHYLGGVCRTLQPQQPQSLDFQKWTQNRMQTLHWQHQKMPFFHNTEHYWIQTLFFKCNHHHNSNNNLNNGYWRWYMLHNVLPKVTCSGSLKMQQQKNLLISALLFKAPSFYVFMNKLNVLPF